MKSPRLQPRRPASIAIDDPQPVRLRLARFLGSRMRGAPRTTLSTSAFSRLEVRPPSLRHAPSSLWQRLMFWLLAPSPQEASPPLNRLPGVRMDFLRAIADIDPDEAWVVSSRIEQARSLRDLWHMRLEVFNLVSLHRSESEAAARLERLSHHFPTRAPRGAVAAGAST